MGPFYVFISIDSLYIKFIYISPQLLQLFKRILQRRFAVKLRNVLWTMKHFPDCSSA